MKLTSLYVFHVDPVNRRLLPWLTRYNIIDEVARGLAYIHLGLLTTIVHCYLKASNVLLWFGKDFGRWSDSCLYMSQSWNKVKLHMYIYTYIYIFRSLASLESFNITLFDDQFWYSHTGDCQWKEEQLLLSWPPKLCKAVDHVRYVRFLTQFWFLFCLIVLWTLGEEGWQWRDAIAAYR